LARAVLDEGYDGRLVTSAGVVENREGNFDSIEGIFTRSDTVATPAALMLLTLQKRGLCRLEVNCVVKFSYFFLLKTR
jgi:hypothetical protein